MYRTGLRVPKACACKAYVLSKWAAQEEWEEPRVLEARQAQEELLDPAVREAWPALVAKRAKVALVESLEREVRQELQARAVKQAKVAREKQAVLAQERPDRTILARMELVIVAPLGIRQVKPVVDCGRCSD